MFLRYAEILMFVVIALVFVTQVFIPMWKGIKVFPIFRSRQRELESKLTKVREEAHEAGLERELKEEQDRVTKLRGQDRRSAS